jgi:hypothetical protein
MSDIDYEALGRLAARWVVAEAQRKVLRSDRNMAFAILATATHCPQRLNADGDRQEFVPETGEQLEWHDRAMRIGRDYDDVYPVARACRAAMTRIVMQRNVKPQHDAELMASSREREQRLEKEWEEKQTRAVQGGAT